MRFATTTRPPAPPRTGFLGRHERCALRSDTAFAATLARKTRDHAPGVVILPDIRGLHLYYEALAEAFADAGVHALTIDLYGRTAGARHRDEGLRLAAAPGRSDRRRRSRRRARGGRRTSTPAASGPSSSSASASAGAPRSWPAPSASTAGRRGGRTAAPTPVDEARGGRFKAPVLAIYGGVDNTLAPEDHEDFAGAFAEAGVLRETVVYDDAPHGFFDRFMSAYAEACADAWRVTLRFFGVPVLD